MGRATGITMTLLSDLFHAVAVILMVVCLAVGNSKPTSNFCWSKFKWSYSSVTYEYYTGLHQYDVCRDTDGRCLTYDFNSGDDANYFGSRYSSVGSDCYTAGSGVIAMATFAMLFGLLAIAALHTYTTFKRACGCTCPVPRLFAALFSILSLGLYIGVVSIWWVKCQNPMGTIKYLPGDPSVSTGYALMVAVICTVFSLLGWIFATIRSFMPPGDDDGPTKSSYGGSSGASSPAHSNSSYSNNVQSPSKEGAFGY